jgi:hypothetical protein
MPLALVALLPAGRRLLLLQSLVPWKPATSPLPLLIQVRCASIPLFRFYCLVNVCQSFGFSSPISCYPLLLVFVELYLLLFLVFWFTSHFRRERNATTRRGRERERESAACLRLLPAATQTSPLHPASTTAAQQSTAARTGGTSCCLLVKLRWKVIAALSSPIVDFSPPSFCSWM